MCRQRQCAVWPVWRKRNPLFAPRMRPCQAAWGNQICAIRVKNCRQLGQRQVDLSTDLVRLRVDQACRDASEYMLAGGAAPQCKGSRAAAIRGERGPRAEAARQRTAKSGISLPLPSTGPGARGSLCGESSAPPGSAQRAVRSAHHRFSEAGHGASLHAPAEREPKGRYR